MARSYAESSREQNYHDCNGGTVRASAWCPFFGGGGGFCSYIFFLAPKCRIHLSGLHPLAVFEFQTRVCARLLSIWGKLLKGFWYYY